MDILVAVEGCVAHEDRWPVICETWGTTALQMPLDFFPYKMRIEWFDGPKLEVPDDYLSLPKKTRAICKWSRDHEYDFTLIADTDSYVSLSRALSSGFENYDYSGYVQTWLPVPYCSGPTYWLSRKSMQVLVETNWDQFAVKDHATAEDVMVGSVLFHRGIRYHHDDRYVNPLGVLPTNNVISEHLTFHAPYTHERMYAAHRKATGGDAT